MHYSIMMCYQYLHVVLGNSSKILDFSISVENVDYLERPRNVFLWKFTSSQNPASSTCTKSSRFTSH